MSLKPLCDTFDVIPVISWPFFETVVEVAQLEEFLKQTLRSLVNLVRSTKPLIVNAVPPLIDPVPGTILFSIGAEFKSVIVLTDASVCVFGVIA